jgi:hypothetical protein
MYYNLLMLLPFNLLETLLMNDFEATFCIFEYVNFKGVCITLPRLNVNYQMML